MCWLFTLTALAGAVCILALQQRTLSNLRREQEQLHRLTAEAGELQTQGQELARLRAENGQFERVRRDHQELHRLREEVQQLREQAKAVEQLHAENLLLRDDHERLQQTQAQVEARQEEQQQLAVAELQVAKEDLLRRVGIGRQIGAAFLPYAKNHRGQLPSDVAQLRDAVSEGESGKVDLSAYELVGTDYLAELEEPAKFPVVREKLKDARGFRVYVFADGHPEIKKDDE